MASRINKFVSSGQVSSWSGQVAYGNINIPSRKKINPPSQIEYLVIAGGGGGTARLGGGGGAGGYRCSVAGEITGGGGSAENPLSVAPNQTLAVIVGAGGAGGTNGTRGSMGNASSLGEIISVGGGGAGYSNGADGLDGGSGGGGGETTNPVPYSTQGAKGGDPIAGIIQGYRGGNAKNSWQTGQNAGGGGGAGGEGVAGGDAVGFSCNGGPGLYSSITGSSIARGGGGGGGKHNSPISSSGGVGGGGAGNAGNSGNGSNGTINTGGGGGGSGYVNVGTLTGGSGGKGVVILRYPSTFSLASATTGSPTQTTTGGYHIYVFNDSGSITF
jgi:hypothetical protein